MALTPDKVPHTPTEWYPIVMPQDITTALLQKTAKAVFAELVKAGKAPVTMDVFVSHFLTYFGTSYLGKRWLEDKTTEFGSQRNCITSKPLTGTLPKRVHKVFHYLAANYPEHPYKQLPPEFLELFGTKIQDALHGGNAAIHVAFAQDFAWKRAQYGDDGSCYWGMRNGARRLLREHGFYSLHVMTDAGSKGRSIIAPLVPAKAGHVEVVSPLKAKFFILMNTYGVAQPTQLEAFHRFLGEPEWIKVQVSVTNNGKFDGNLLYANQSRGMYVGPAGAAKDVTRFDFRINDVGLCQACGGNPEAEDEAQGCECPGTSVDCAMCGRRRHANYTVMVYTNKRDTDFAFVDQVRYCRTGCYDRANPWRCAACEHWYDAESFRLCAAHIPQGGGAHHVWCIACARRHCSAKTFPYCVEHSKVGPTGTYRVVGNYHDHLRIQPYEG